MIPVQKPDDVNPVSFQRLTLLPCGLPSASGLRTENAADSGTCHDPDVSTYVRQQCEHNDNNQGAADTHSSHGTTSLESLNPNQHGCMDACR